MLKSTKRMAIRKCFTITNKLIIHMYEFQQYALVIDFNEKTKSTLM